MAQIFSQQASQVVYLLLYGVLALVLVLPGLEWQTGSPPPPDNFETLPTVTEPPYQYALPEIDRPKDQP